jgi:hypothetical protein
MVSDQTITTSVPNGEINPEDYDKTPWMFKEARRLELGNRLKMLFLLGLVITGIYFMFQWFGWFFLLGLLPAPAWYFWALRQIDRESYLLIEIRLKGDEYFPGKKSPDTQTNIYQIPPDVWKDIKKVGTANYIGSRIYFCDRFHKDEKTGDQTVYFGESVELSNMSFIGKVELWLKTKKMIPRLQREVAYFRYHNEILAMEKATAWLEQFGILEGIMEDGIKPIQTRTIIKEGVEHGG